MQVDLWGVPLVKRGSFFIYHDESEPNKRWLLIGLLFVPRHRVDEVRKVLRYYRDKERYYDEVHFSKLPGSFGGEYGMKARLAKSWMKAYESSLHEFAYFTVLAVDRQSPKFEHKRFSQDFHAYNRFTVMAIKSGIAWHLVPFEFHEVELTFISDAKDRKSRLDQGIMDNFESYIPYKIELETWFSREFEGKPYPQVYMHPVQLRDSKDDDLLQLTDLILGAVQEALVAGSRRETKRTLGKMACRWCIDTRKPPWEQQYGMYHKFNLWGFPDAKGRPFNNLTLALDQQSQSLALFNQ